MTTQCHEDNDTPEHTTGSVSSLEFATSEVQRVEGLCVPTSSLVCDRKDVLCHLSPKGSLFWKKCRKKTKGTASWSRFTWKTAIQTEEAVMVRVHTQQHQPHVCNSLSSSLLCLQWFDNVGWAWEEKKWVMRCWRRYRSAARCKCIWSSWWQWHCHPIISCFAKIQNGLTFLWPGPRQTYSGCPENRPLNGALSAAHYYHPLLILQTDMKTAFNNITRKI